MPPALAPGDAKLVAGVRRGDEGAFERIYDRHAAELLSFCRHMLGSRDEAEDALQQTFLNAYGALRRSRSPISLRPWLFTIARNECLSMLRGRKMEGDQAQVPSTAGLAAQVEEREELKSMLADIARLPAEQREALILSSVQRLSGEAVAGILGTDRARVKALVYRARRSLAQSRDARDASCADIREQLGVLRGGSLRRRVLREHMLECDGCREFRLDVRRQRQLVGALMPVPLPLAIKASCLPAAAGTSKAATAGGAGIGIGLASGASGAGIATKVVVGVTGLAAVAVAVADGPRGELTDDVRDRRAPALVTPAGQAVRPDPRGLAPASAAEPPRPARERRDSAGARPDRGDGSPRPHPADAGESGEDVGPAPDAPPSVAGSEDAAAGALSPANGGSDQPVGGSGRPPAKPPPGHAAAGGSAAPPGHGGSPPGHGGRPPGQGGSPPGHGGSPPGQGGTPPGHSATPPGQSANAPGHSAKPPRHDGHAAGSRAGITRQPAPASRVI